MSWLELWAGLTFIREVAAIALAVVLSLVFLFIATRR